MNAVTIYLLRAKSWQIFALVIGLWVLGQIVAAISLIRSMESPDELLNVPLGFGIVTVLMMCCLSGWYWSIGTFLSLRVPSALRLKSGFFRCALVYPAIYVPFFIGVFKTLNAVLTFTHFPPTFSRYVLFVLPFVFRFQESRFSGDGQASVVQRLCCPIFLDLVLPHWHLVHPAQNQPSIHAEPLRH
jgi:hypothetical protein